MADEVVSRTMRPEVISRAIRKKFFYKVEAAGMRVGLSRAQSYRAVELGQIPAERHGKFLLVPRRRWDAEVKRLMRGSRAKSRRVHKTADFAT
jgi:hypothetical protein